VYPAVSVHDRVVPLRVHALVHDQGEPLLGAREALDHGEELLEHGGEEAGVVQVAGVGAPPQGDFPRPLHQKPQAHLAEVVFSLLVVSPPGQLGRRMRGHVGVVVCGVEEQAVGRRLLQFGDLGEEAPADLC